MRRGKKLAALLCAALLLCGLMAIGVPVEKAYGDAYAQELEYFSSQLDKRLKLREQEAEEYRQQVEERERMRRERIARKTLSN